MEHTVAISFADGKTLFCAVPHNGLLLDAALRNGIKIPMDCREGVCGSCQGRCEFGEYQQDYVDEETLTGQDLAERKVLSCQTRVLSDCGFSFDFDSSLCGASGTELFQGRVTEVRAVSASTSLIELELAGDGAELSFLPGQYARLKVPGTDQFRSYSFATAPGRPRVRFLVRMLPSGVMTDYVRARCAVGDVINFEAPLGSFYLRQVQAPLVFIAGGTGLSAFLGMLDVIAERGSDQPVHLYHGVRNATDLCELDRIEAYAQKLPGFRFTPVVSEPDPNWAGKRGFITEHLQHDPSLTGVCDVYLCGPPPMVESVKTWANGEGLSNVRLFAEKFLQSNT